MAKSENRDFKGFEYQKCIKMEIQVSNRIRRVYLTIFHCDIGIFLFVYLDTQISLDRVYI